MAADSKCTWNTSRSKTGLIMIMLWSSVFTFFIGFTFGKEIAIDFKRHHSTFNPKKVTLSPHAAGLTRCRDVCKKVNEECSSNCWSPFGAGHNPFTTAWTAFTVSYNATQKFECLESCLSKDDDLYVIPNECIVANASDAQDLEPSRNKQVITDVSQLTTKERCKLEAYRNSTVCDFETDMPETARKIFNKNRPKFSLCTGGTVLVGSRGLYTSYSGSKSFFANPALFEATGRSKRSDEDAEENEEDDDEEPERQRRGKRSAGKQKNKRMKRNSKKRSKRQVNRRDLSGGNEICVTEKSIESPSKALHQRTETVVDLYFHGGYSQWFELGTCKNSDPVISIKIGGRSNVGRCKSALTAHRAYILIETAKTPRAKQFQGCGKVPALDAKYEICYDWVLLPSHCKFFYS